MYQFNLNYIWSNWVGPTQLQFIQWIIFLNVGYWSLSSRNDPKKFCSLHWRNLSLYNKITTTHFKQIRFWWKNVIKFCGKVYSNFFKFVQQLFFLSVEYPFNSDSFQFDPVSRSFQVIWFFTRRPNGSEVYIFDLFKADTFRPTHYVVFIGAFIRSNGGFDVLVWFGTDEGWSRICPKGMS